MDVVTGLGGALVKTKLIAVSEKMRAVLAHIESVAPLEEIPVLLGGESGTGKELAARLLHAKSPRARRPFVALDCAALPDSLLEAELFGHARGAFTGAVESRRGLLEEADGGTLFLDEIADLSRRAQTSILRALQEREYRRLGETRLRSSNFRLVTATHKDLEEEVASGRFRRDLYFRLKVVRIELPALRERPSDILPLARHYLAAKARRLGLPAPRLSPEAEQALLSYAWPGNVRELENEIVQALIRARNEELVRPEHLSAPAKKKARAPLRAASLAFEKKLLIDTLNRSGGNRTRAARVLGLSRQGLYRKLKRHGLMTIPAALPKVSVAK